MSCVYYDRMLSSILSPYSLDASDSPHSSHDNQNVYRHCQISPGSKSAPSLKHLNKINKRTPLPHVVYALMGSIDNKQTNIFITLVQV